jgi:hypothetical protein
MRGSRAAKKSHSDAIFPKFWRTTSVSVLPVAPKEGRKMYGRKILLATHFCAPHLSALFLCSGDREQKQDNTQPPQGRVFIAPLATILWLAFTNVIPHTGLMKMRSWHLIFDI